MEIFTKYRAHFLAVAGFVVIALLYFYPVIQGKELYQSDIAQFIGMAREQNDFRAAEDAEPFWTNAAFGGMPTYQMGAYYPHNYVKMLDSALRFLPRPADYLFLYFACFYVLMLTLRTDPLKAFFGALAFGLSTYMIIIIGVGHNAKAHAIAYMPLVIAGVILVFRRRYLVGGIVTALAAALEISANHFQMTYYLLLLLLPIVVYYIIQYVREKATADLGRVGLVFLVAGVLAIGANASNLLATAEYTDFSIRGKSELSFNPDGSKNETTASMDYEYITEYSYGVAESFNLIAPRLFGGSNSERLGPDSEAYQFALAQGASDAEAREFASSLPTYWGDQPIVAAPAYIGAVVFFLAVLALFVDRRKIKYAFLAGAILSLLLSWGKNFDPLTRFFVDYVPLYDKFRAVSSIQVVLELCFPVLAVMGLTSFFTEPDVKRRVRKLWQTSGVCIGLILMLALCKGAFDFSGPVDAQIPEQLIGILKQDRKTMYSADLLRSGFLIVLAILVLWFAHKEKLSQRIAVIAIGIIMVGDLFFIDKNYVDSSKFVSARQAREPFEATDADRKILQDTGIFRVYEITGRLQARTSFFHKSVGGYSAVRPRRMDQLFTYQVEPKLDSLSKNIDPETLKLTKGLPVLNMLNVKYVLADVGDGEKVPLENSAAFGPAWFTDEVRFVNSADEEMKALDDTDLRNVAIVNRKQTANGFTARNAVALDPNSAVKLIEHKPNYIKYQTQSRTGGTVVFSEVYYPKGWQACIDGKAAPHFRADYTLRAMDIPAGNHTVEFKFEPQVVKTGGTISAISSLLIVVLAGGGLYYSRRRKETE
jgi:LPXTG-motif cell wall-anchored protein